MLSGQKHVWNWAAAWGGPFWLLYRKAYGLGLLLLTTLVICGLLLNFFFATMPGSSLSTATFGTFLSIGNNLYLLSLKRKISLGYHRLSLKKHRFFVTFFLSSFVWHDYNFAVCRVVYEL
ncbi:DUF2628 domain-containing protein [Candidatus Finniella inopinata]